MSVYETMRKFIDIDLLSLALFDICRRLLDKMSYILRSLTLSATNDKILSVYKKSSGFIQLGKTANVRSAICAHA